MGTKKNVTIDELVKTFGNVHHELILVGRGKSHQWGVNLYHCVTCRGTYKFSNASVKLYYLRDKENVFKYYLSEMDVEDNCGKEKR